MKGIIQKTLRGWIVKQILGEGPEVRHVKIYPLHETNVKNLEPSVLGEFGEVEFEIVQGYNKFFNKTEPHAKLCTPILDNLRIHLDNITDEQFNKEIDEIIAHEYGVYSNDTESNKKTSSFTEVLKFDRETAEGLYRIFCGLSRSCYDNAEVYDGAKHAMKKAYEKILSWGSDNCVDIRGEISGCD